MLLSRREHSRLELRRKLGPHAEDPTEIDTVINDLERQGFFNEERFAAAFVTRKGSKFGLMRVKQELSEHKLEPALAQRVLLDLKSTELARAREVWRKKFAKAPTSIEDKATQHRFLSQRGFGNETIQQIFRYPNDK